MARPNILYFVAHDLGRHLGCYGLPVPSPNIDAFAAQSVRFLNAHCSSPACSPSRICAMTGLHAHRSGGIGLAHMGWPLAPEVPTAVDWFREGGYETIHAGMQHERIPRSNRYEVELETDWDCHNTHRGVNDALAHLAKRDRSRPFYLNLGSQQPHPSTWDKADTLHGGVVPPDQTHVPPYVPDTPEVRASFGRFQAAIRYMDREFGRLLEGLAALGHDRDTVVIFTVDHGINNPRAKSTLYDAGTEIALLVRMPGGAGAGATVPHLIPNIDFAPTWLDLAGINAPAGIDGRSFAPLLTGAGGYTPRREIFTERNFHGEYRYRGAQPRDPVTLYRDRFDPVRAIRTEEFHYIRNFDPTIKGRARMPWETAPADTTLAELGFPPPVHPRPAEELYHTARDPMEIFNLADKPEFQPVMDALAGRLRAWMEETGDFVLRDEVPQRRGAPGYGDCFGAS